MNHYRRVQGRFGGYRSRGAFVVSHLKSVIAWENGRRRAVTKLEAILKQLVNRAAQGDHRATQLLLAHQIPRIEEDEASRSAIVERSPLPPLPSAEEERRRDLENAKSLHDTGGIDTGNPEGNDRTAQWPAHI